MELEQILNFILTDIVARLVVFAILFAATIIVIILTLRRRVVTGAEGMIGKIGVVKKALAPEGKILVHGEIWTAVSHDGARIEPDQKVEVLSMQGMELTVKKIS